jgi:hypothetical protein
VFLLQDDQKPVHQRKARRGVGDRKQKKRLVHVCHVRADQIVPARQKLCHISLFGVGDQVRGLHEHVVPHQGLLAQSAEYPLGAAAVDLPARVDLIEAGDALDDFSLHGHQLSCVKLSSRVITLSSVVTVWLPLSSVTVIVSV